MNTLSTRLQNRLHDRLRQSKDEKGFTLIELLIVIVILGILAGVVIFASARFADSGKQEACDTTRKATLTAAEAFRSQSTTGVYPAAIGDLIGAGDYLELSGGTNSGTIPIPPAPPSSTLSGVYGKGWYFTWAAGATTADAPAVGPCVVA
jgi:prepilin-type N-terminal cleavage/methylation domain-containing protein